MVGEGREGQGQRDSQLEPAREPPQGPKTCPCIQLTLEQPGLHLVGTGRFLINTIQKYKYVFSPF